MDYSHDTWVLDEGDDAAVRKLRPVGAHHFSRHAWPQYQRPSGRFASGSKHGNYNAWFDAVGFDRYDVIATLDPDHVPEKNYLTRTLGYFQDPSVAFVQAPQIYYNQIASFIARGAAEEPCHSDCRQRCHHCTLLSLTRAKAWWVTMLRLGYVGSDDF